MKTILDESLGVGEDSPNKAYKMRIYFDPLIESSQESEILALEEGVFTECSSIPGGRHLIAVTSLGSGTIHVELEVCRGV
jgi:hypothetical protein